MCPLDARTWGAKSTSCSSSEISAIRFPPRKSAPKLVSGEKNCRDLSTTEGYKGYGHTYKHGGEGMKVKAIISSQHNSASKALVTIPLSSSCNSLRLVRPTQLLGSSRTIRFLVKT